MSTEAHTFAVWGVDLPASALTEEERSYLEGLPDQLPSHEWVCSELDRVWRKFGLDNRRPLDGQPVDEFYNHPVWLMNGVYSAVDPVSVGHRRAIATWVSSRHPARVVDVGGGFGELALHIRRETPEARVDILEPFPSEVARARLRDEGVDVRHVPELTSDGYDVVIAQDVLEHVEEPIELAIDLVRAVRPGGVAIFANSFTPIIECHLPRTFHLRRTFPLVMRALGLTPRGRVVGAAHALLFEVPPELHPDWARRSEAVSQVAVPLVRGAAAVRARTRDLLARRLPR